jgi:hypothetical protein
MAGGRSVFDGDSATAVRMMASTWSGTTFIETSVVSRRHTAAVERELHLMQVWAGAGVLGL